MDTLIKNGWYVGLVGCSYSPPSASVRGKKEEMRGGKEKAGGPEVTQVSKAHKVPYHVFAPHESRS